MRRLTVLGSCGAWPEPGRACSGYLVEYDGFRLVLDLGFATLPRLLRLCQDGAVDAVVVTHAHSDHCVDLNGLLRVRHYAGAGRIPLLCPPSVAELVDTLEPRPRLAELFDVVALPGTHQVGPLRLDAVELPHHVPNAGVRLTAPGVTVAYSGDTGPDPALVALGADADVFVMEATLQGAPPAEEPRYLTTAREAGELAEAAGARRLLLTHFWPGADRAVSRAEAAMAYSGELLIAEEDLVVAL